jgi:hypothetical protein
MARGWESKSVSDQIEERAERKAAAPAVSLSAEEIERRQKRDGLRLTQTRMREALERAAHPRHRAMLERALAEVNAELATLEGGVQGLGAGGGSLRASTTD